MRLLCDEMLSGIGRWLRAAGYDTAIAAKGSPDDDVVAQARTECRVLLTCDRALATRVGDATPGSLMLLSTESPEAAARALRDHLGIDWLHAPFSRCLLDNASLRPAGLADLARLPERGRENAGPVTVCPDCGRIYWSGSHVRRMRARLRRWREAT